jgi:DNA replication protein DnaC
MGDESETASPTELREWSPTVERDGIEVRSMCGFAPGEDQDSCSWCNGARYVAVREYTGGMFTGNRYKPCGKCAAVEREARWDRIGVAPILTFDDWRDAVAMRPAKQACEELLAGKRHVAFLTAGTGCGKTHLAKATVVEWVRQGKGSALFRTVPELLQELRDTFDDDTPHGLSQRMKAYADIGLLVLDDLGAEKGTEFAQEKLFSIVDRRLGAGRKKPTLVTSNCAPDSDRIGHRVASRLAPGHVHIPNGIDFRQQHLEPKPWAR